MENQYKEIKSREEIKQRIKKIEEEVMDRFRKGCNQARLKDIGELQALRWVLNDNQGEK